MPSRASTVDAYLAELPPDRREVLARLRSLASEELTGFEERMEYGMAYYRRGRDEGFGFASRKQYVALYVGLEAVAPFRARLTDADLGRGCVRFRHVERIDFGLVKELLHSIARS